MGRKLSKDSLKAVHAKNAGLTGFNIKLQKKEVIRNPREVTFKNGRKAIAGIGSDGTKIFRIIKG